METVVTLWVTVSTSYSMLDPGEHYGCTGSCDKTRLAPIQVQTSCETWADLCNNERDECSFPDARLATPAPSPTPAGSNSGDWFYATQAPFVSTSFESTSFVPPPSAHIIIPTAPMPGPMQVTSTPMTTTTKTTATTTYSSALFTDAPTMQPPPTTPSLRPQNCPPISDWERAHAPYTQWELHWELSRSAVDMLMINLNWVFQRIPPRFFQQRPKDSEKIRLIWECLVDRSPIGFWLNKWGNCPSAPAEALFNWFHAEENWAALDLARQGLDPPEVVPLYFNDWALRKAWEEQAADGGVTTTAPPLLEQAEAFEPVPTPAPPPVTTANPPLPRAPSQALPDKGEVPGAEYTFAKCHTAKFSKEWDSVVLWHEITDACLFVNWCNRVWAMRGGLLLTIALALIHIVPAFVSFWGSSHQFYWYFPPACGLYISQTIGFILAVVISLSISMGVPHKLNGTGFVCTIVAELWCLGCFGCTKLANSMAQEAAHKKVLEEERRQTTAAPVPTPNARVAWADVQPPLSPGQYNGGINLA